MVYGAETPNPHRWAGLLAMGPVEGGGFPPPPLRNRQPFLRPMKEIYWNYATGRVVRTGNPRRLIVFRASARR